jgi:hypothetical protein
MTMSGWVLQAAIVRFRDTDQCGQLVLGHAHGRLQCGRVKTGPLVDHGVSGWLAHVAAARRAVRRPLLAERLRRRSTGIDQLVTLKVVPAG